MLLAESLLGRRYGEAKHATFVAIPGPPPGPQDREVVLFAQPLAWRGYFLGSIAFCAPRVAMTSAPIARSDWPAVNLAKSLLLRAGSFRDGFSWGHTLSITQLRISPRIFGFRERGLARIWGDSPRVRARLEALPAGFRPILIQSDLTSDSSHRHPSPPPLKLGSFHRFRLRVRHGNSAEASSDRNQPRIWPDRPLVFGQLRRPFLFNRHSSALCPRAPQSSSNRHFFRQPLLLDRLPWCEFHCSRILRA